MGGWRLELKQDPVNQLGFRETGLVELSHAEDGSWEGKGERTVFLENFLWLHFGTGCR